MVNLNKSISKAKYQNAKLKKNIGLVENETNTSNEMISNYKEMYDYAYLRNWALLLSIMLYIGVITKV
jgi:hypothetical protein